MLCSEAQVLPGGWEVVGFPYCTCPETSWGWDEGLPVQRGPPWVSGPGLYPVPLKGSRACPQAVGKVGEQSHFRMAGARLPGLSMPPPLGSRQDHRCTDSADLSPGPPHGRSQGCPVSLGCGMNQGEAGAPGCISEGRGPTVAVRKGSVV